MVRESTGISCRKAFLHKYSLFFLTLWYVVPVGLFFCLARTLGINLFVERYLILSSLPVFLLVLAIQLEFTPASRHASFWSPIFSFIFRRNRAGISSRRENSP